MQLLSAVVVVVDKSNRKLRICSRQTWGRNKQTNPAELPRTEIRRYYGWQIQILLPRRRLSKARVYGSCQLELNLIKSFMSACLLKIDKWQFPLHGAKKGNTGEKDVGRMAGTAGSRQGLPSRRMQLRWQLETEAQITTKTNQKLNWNLFASSLLFLLSAIIT